MPLPDHDTGPPNPAAVLGVSAEAGEEELRAAYLRKVREYPPDRAPAEFERIRDAYELLRDPRRRARLMLQGADPWAPLATLLGAREGARRHVGPARWLKAIQDLKCKDLK